LKLRWHAIKKTAFGSQRPSKAKPKPPGGVGASLPRPAESDRHRLIEQAFIKLRYGDGRNDLIAATE